MDKFSSCETCLFCLTPVEQDSKVNWELKTNNYQDIIACNRKALKDKIMAHHSDWVCPPEGPSPTLCVKCFKCAENIYNVIRQMMELHKYLEALIESSSLEINERISRLAPDGSLLADEIKVEDTKEEIYAVAEESDGIISENSEIISTSFCTNESNFNEDKQDVLVTEMDLDVDGAHLEEEVLLTSDEFHNIVQKIEVSVPSPLQFLSDGEWDKTDVDPLELDKTSNVDEECGNVTHDGVEYEIECPICQKKYTSRNDFREHIKSHGDKIFVCDICGKKVNTNKNLQQHIRLAHKLQKGHACDKCGRRFKHRSRLQLHIENVHEKVKNYKCSICERFFSQKHSCQMHELKHKDETKRIDTFKCSVCERSFIYKSYLQSHELTHRKKRERKDANICKICDKQFALSASLKYHQIHFHTAYTEETSNCDKCGNKFLNGLDLYKHSSYQDPDSSANCMYCKGIFQNRCDLLIHVANSHPAQKIPYKCEKCGLVLSASRYLTGQLHSKCC